MVTHKDGKHRAEAAACLLPLLPELMVRLGAGSRPQPGKQSSWQSELRHPKNPAQLPQSRGTYLALPGHTDGRAVLAAGGTVNDLLCLPDVEAVPHCLAVQLTLPIALYYQNKQNKTEKTKLLASFFFLYFY